VAAGGGLFLAYFLTGAPELRGLRLAQMIFLPLAFMAAWSVLPEPSQGYASVGALIGFAAILVFIAALLAPNAGHYCGVFVANFLDPQDWASAEEEIALRPIVKLIDKDRFEEARDGLEALLKKHKPTYEALLLQAKLLHHFQRDAEGRAALLQMIPLSRTTDQQLAVMELLAGLGAHQSTATEPTDRGPTQMRITHELVLFPTGAADRSVHKIIPAGAYQVNRQLVRGQCWLVPNGEDWGNTCACWEAVRETDKATETAAGKGLLWQIARMQESVILAVRGKTWRQSQEEARLWQKEANRLIRQGNWGAALPCLQKAATEDPENFEIAYRLVQAARLAGGSANPSAVLSRVLRQGRWTEDQERMLQQLNS
jgi:thioredoxin-like negative regulator of GroEL